MRQNTKEYLGGLSAEQQALKKQERMIPGLKWSNMEDGFVPSLQSSNSAREIEGSWQTTDQLMNKAIGLLSEDPRNVGWTDKWNELKSLWASIAQAKNKLNANGVMNFNDWDNIIQEIGDPNTANQWINKGAIKRLETAKNSGEIQRLAKLSGYGYEPGSMKMSDTGRGQGGSGSGGKSGPLATPSPEALNQMAQKAGLGNLGLTQNKPQVQQAQQPSGKQVVDRVVDKVTGTTLIQYSDGTFDEVR
jgi:hypothetical protein